MGRNKIKIQKIDNERIRQVTFYKRKRGLIKKSMELSLLCEVKVLLCVVDKNEKLVVYCSDGMTSDIMQNSLCNDHIQKEYLTNDDDLFSECINLDENEEASRKQERLTEKEIEGEEEKFEIIDSQNKVKEIGSLINSCKVNNRSESQKKNESVESRLQNKFNSSSLNKNLHICFDKISNRFLHGVEKKQVKKEDIQSQSNDMPNLEVIINKDLVHITKGNILDNYLITDSNENLLNKLGSIGNDFGSHGAYENNLINYNILNMQKQQNNFYKNDMNSLGMNLNNSHSNLDVIKNMIPNLNVPNNNTSRNIDLGMQVHDLNNQKFLQNFFSHNFMNSMNPMNSLNNSLNISNYPMNQLTGILNNNTQFTKSDSVNMLNNQNHLNEILYANGKFNRNPPYNNMGNELHKKRMRENEVVSNLNSLTNVNNKLSESNNWFALNSVNDFNGSGVGVNSQNNINVQNIVNAQNMLYNYIQANNLTKNSTTGFVNEQKLS